MFATAISTIPNAATSTLMFNPRATSFSIAPRAAAALTGIAPAKRAVEFSRRNNDGIGQRGFGGTVPIRNGSWESACAFRASFQRAAGGQAGNTAASGTDDLHIHRRRSNRIACDQPFRCTYRFTVENQRNVGACSANVKRNKRVSPFAC